MRTRFFIRIKSDLNSPLIKYLDENLLDYSHISNDMGPTSVFSVLMNNEEALALRLKFPLIGFLSFDKRPDGQLHRFLDL